MRYVRTFSRAVVSAALALSMVCSGAAFAAETATPIVRVIPDDLNSYAVEHGCEQVSDFYTTRPDIKEAPYVYGVLLSPYSDTSAAFWCQTSGGKNKYVLLLRLNERQWPGGCAARIEDQDIASGLSVIRRLDEPLDLYTDASTHAVLANVKPDEKTSGVGIQSAYGETGHIYYCHEGRWVARALK